MLNYFKKVTRKRGKSKDYNVALRDGHRIADLRRRGGIEIGNPPVQVFVKVQSIIDAEVDVVVVPRTKYLQGGMVASIIESKGGPMILKECKEIMKKRNNQGLQTGNIRVTEAGKLPYKAIINAVNYPPHGPPGSDLIEAVNKIVENCLHKTEKMKHSSIAIPAISGGNAGHPKDDIAMGMICGIMTFCQNNNRRYLKKILLVDVNEEQISLWKKHLSFTTEGNDSRDEKSTTDSMGASGGHETGMPHKENAVGQIGELPKNWSPMKNGQNMLLVDIVDTDIEFQEVVKDLKDTCGKKSPFRLDKIRIKRVQNKTLFTQYMALKAKIENASSSGNITERSLWHGTSKDAIIHINNEGFNRSYAVVTLYGKGTYFAVNSSYALQNDYAVPDDDGFKYIYKAKVLTGEYTQGSKEMIEPPPKDSSDPTVKYDSVVDDINRPNMFVVFKDAQAYPEYLITYKKS